MRYRLICEVEGELYLRDKRSVTSEHDGVLYELIADEGGRAAQAAVSLQVPPDRLGKTGTSFGPPLPGTGTILTLNISTDYQVHSRLVTALQRMESLFALNRRGPLVRRIRWDVVSREYIAENEEDKKYIAVHTITSAERNTVPRNKISHNEFEIIIQNAERFESLRVVSAFWREGNVALQDGRYIQAIYAFYFILEDMCGENKTGEKAVLTAFRKTESLTEALTQAVVTFPEGGGVHMRALHSFFQEMKLSWDVDGVRIFLVRMRGRLHHYTGRSSLRQGTPFTEGGFHAVALLFVYVASLVLMLRVVEINRLGGPLKGPSPESVRG